MAMRPCFVVHQHLPTARSSCFAGLLYSSFESRIREHIAVPVCTKRQDIVQKCLRSFTLSLPASVDCIDILAPDLLDPSNIGR